VKNVNLVEALKTAPRIVGLDLGERKGKTVAIWDVEESSPIWSISAQTTTKFYDNGVQAVSDTQHPEGTVFVMEAMLGNFSRNQRSEAYDAAAKNGYEIYPINSRHTKNRAKDHNLRRPSESDKLAAWILLQIGKEGVIPPCAMREFLLSNRPSTRLRQVGYDVNHPEFAVPLPEDQFEQRVFEFATGLRVESAVRGKLASAVEFISSLPVPDCAITMKAAEEGKRIGRRWVTDCTYFNSAIIRSLEVIERGNPSWRKMKATVRDRGQARSDYMHHGLGKKAAKHPESRKEIMKAQNEYDRFVFMQISRWAASRYIRGKSASPHIRGPREKVSAAGASRVIRGKSASPLIRAAAEKQLSLFGGD
jgi:hypothetical protein